MRKVPPGTLAESPLSPARKQRLARLAKRPEQEIDLSDIPELPESFWQNAVRNPFYKPVKQQAAVRLDGDARARAIRPE